jgi:hypothetical protein
LAKQIQGYQQIHDFQQAAKDREYDPSYYSSEAQRMSAQAGEAQPLGSREGTPWGWNLRTLGAMPQYLWHSQEAGNTNPNAFADSMGDSVTYLQQAMDQTPGPKLTTKPLDEKKPFEMSVWIPRVNTNMTLKLPQPQAATSIDEVKRALQAPRDPTKSMNEIQRRMDAAKQDYQDLVNSAGVAGIQLPDSVKAFSRAIEDTGRAIPDKGNKLRDGDGKLIKGDLPPEVALPPKPQRPPGPGTTGTPTPEPLPGSRPGPTPQKWTRDNPASVANDTEFHNLKLQSGDYYRDPNKVLRQMP